MYFALYVSHCFGADDFMTRFPADSRVVVCVNVYRRCYKGLHILVAVSSYTHSIVIRAGVGSTYIMKSSNKIFLNI